MVSYSHLICAAGFYVAIVSGTVDSDHREQEIQPALELLGEIMDMFVSVSTIYEPIDASVAQQGLWVTSSYDATSHFESASEEILAMYEGIVGEKLDLNIEPDDEDDY